MFVVNGVAYTLGEVFWTLMLGYGVLWCLVVIIMSYVSASSFRE